LRKEEIHSKKWGINHESLLRAPVNTKREKENEGFFAARSRRGGRHKTRLGFSGGYVWKEGGLREEIQESPIGEEGVRSVRELIKAGLGATKSSDRKRD